MGKRKKISVWRIIPIVVEAVRIASLQVGLATGPESDGGELVTPNEAGKIAAAISEHVAQAIVAELTYGYPQ
jgi:acyl-CoA reductase-like NAD-dependent aldehyde dehydrogenase